MMLSKKNKLLHYLANSKLANKNRGREWIITSTVRVTWSTAHKLAQSRKSFRLTGADEASPFSHAGSGMVLQPFCKGFQASTHMRNHILTHRSVHTLRSCKGRAEQLKKRAALGSEGDHSTECSNMSSNAQSPSPKQSERSRDSNYRGSDSSIGSPTTVRQMQGSESKPRSTQKIRTTIQEQQWVWLEPGTPTT